ncbi:MAG: sigma-70 family RNA polymerase sigma factor [Paludibacter sp.]|nr:sigma-70 family RNA polymerase sigma factor [Paludibacter sp.]
MSDNRFDEELQIIAAAKRGEAKAQKKIYERYASTMMSVCYRYVSDTETAKDLLQDGFIKLFTKIDTYSGIGSFGGWARRVFVTTCLEYLRHKDALKLSSTIDDYEHSLPEMESSVMEKISADDLLKLISELAEGYRTVFNLFAIEGYTHAEIAVMLGVSEVTSRTQFMRARKLLQKSVLQLEQNGK